MRLWRLVVGGVLLGGFLACSSSKHPGAIADYGSTGGAAGSGGVGGDAGPIGLDIWNKPTPDGACGYQAVDVHRDPSNLYFVIDRSGSMSESVGGKQKFAAVRNAVVDLTAQIGFRARIGAALFPDPSSGDSCAPGREVFPLTDGDPLSYAQMNKYGPVTGVFEIRINSLPNGGTPTAATLDSLAPQLASYGKNTFVILATDGGPNCNDAATCGISECTINIDQVPGCPPTVNCCDPGVSSQFSRGDCLDSHATLSAVSSLAAAGVKTIVVGIPGSDAYGNLLSSLAVAGGAPRAEDPRYYRVDDLDQLGDVLSKIGSDVIVSCDLTLSAPPANPDLVNVWFDDTEIPSDADVGWTYTGEASIEVHGAACDLLQSGAVASLQVFEGCPTKTTK